MDDEILRILENNPLFQAFTAEERRELAQRVTLREFSAGSRIYAQGSTGEFFGIVVRGSVEAVRQSEDGKRQSLAVLREGEFFGEMALITSSPRNADVIAVVDTTILVIPAPVFSKYFTANLNALAVIAKAVSDRLAMNNALEDRIAREKREFMSADDPYNIAPRSDGAPMKVLVINCGSSSLKYKYYDTADESRNMSGLIERIGLQGSRHLYEMRGGKCREEMPIATHGDAFREMERVLTHPEKGSLGSLQELTAVGHRVVHGGDRFVGSELLTDEVIGEIRRMIPLAPLHNPVNLTGIEECLKVVPDTPQVAVFDTAFHQKMLPHAYLYGLPYPLYEKYRVRRYGFHGTSHSYVAMKAATFLRKPFHHLNIITCHLGNGASVCAINHGRSIDTSMGLTPVEGLIMGTRCGDLDPGLMIFLAREESLDAKGLDNLINKESGLKGISGVSNDMREVMEAAKNGDRKALLAVQVFCYRIKKYIGAYTAALGGVDAVVFTGGIGQGSVEVRARVCQGLQHMGIVVSEERNGNPQPSEDGIFTVSDETSAVPVLVVPTDEERMIARETLRALQFRETKERIKGLERIAIPVATVGLHVRISESDRDLLFGPNFELRPRFKLSQPDEFLAEETVTVIGRKNSIRSVPVVIPWTDQTEVSVTEKDEYILGLDAPVRSSGDIDGTPGVTLEGPLGRVTLEKGVIQHRRHIHIAPEDALRLSLKDHDLVSVAIEGKTPAHLDDVVVEIYPRANLELHIDDYEAQTLETVAGSTAFIEGVYERKY